MGSDVLQEHPLLADAQAEQIAALMNAGRIRRWAPGETILHQGDTGDGLYFIRSGTVKIAVGDEGGGQVTIALLEPPESFGELAVLDGGSRSASAVALTAVETLFVRRMAFLDFVHAYPEVRWRLLRQLCRRLRSTDVQLATILFLDVDERLAGVLLRLAAPANAAAVRPAETPPLTQQELAELVGASRESVNKAIHRFTAEGAVGRIGRRITVLRPEILRRIAPAGRHQPGTTRTAETAI
ncbi:MAG: Crp/Fnr family transcriptional regulator [Chloroflexi bacterium]|nr:Crp/Fnr family transcriptional regulator [Chloroflexota bacterium]